MNLSPKIISALSCLLFVQGCIFHQFNDADIQDCRNYIIRSHTPIEEEVVLNIEMLPAENTEIYINDDTIYLETIPFELIVSPKGELFINMTLYHLNTGQGYIFPDNPILNFQLLNKELENSAINMPMKKMGNSTFEEMKFYVKLSNSQSLNSLRHSLLLELAVVDPNTRKLIMSVKTQPSGQEYFKRLIPCLTNMDVVRYVSTAYFPSLYE